MDLSMYSSAVSAVLLLVLIGVYLRVYRDTHAQFSIGLTVFASILFAQNVLAVYSFLTMASLIAEGFLPFLLTINLAEVLGIAVLLRTTTR
ncbi:hypothetical protein E6H29_12135 [Candidatus Bathyarchaeota archaeon]|nr:MAG: hypothetical protein E6H29_12135 [Candidatus Bathyarchaeota archaeon]